MDTDCPTLRFGGVLYRIPFSHLFRAHTEAEKAGLVASIREHGVQVRILTYDSEQHGVRCIIDGATRLAIAAELGLSAIAAQHRGRISDDEAEALAQTLNRDRRHLTLEEQQQQRRERVKRVAAARAAGESTRVISQKEGVSQMQVRRDLAEVGETGVSPDAKSESPASEGETEAVFPDRIVGTDGKRYPVRRREPTQPARDPALVAAEAILGTAQEACETLRRSLDQLRGTLLAASLDRVFAQHQVADLAPLDAALSDLALEIVQSYQST